MDDIIAHKLVTTFTSLSMKEYARAEEVLAGFGVDSVSASDLSCGIGVSETAEY
jgi:hypothetical protein